MSVDPSLALQKAIRDAVKGESPALASGRIYDRPPAVATFPYITIGEGQSISNIADCYDGTESFLDVHVWSREVGFPEAKQIADGLRDLLRQDSLTVTGHTLELFEFQSSRFLRDPDGLTNHIAMSFRALTQPAD